jgi:hypothetical protein
MVIKVRAVWTALNVSLVLTRPLFGDWQRIPVRFFEMIHDSLSDLIPLKSSEFTVIASAQLSEVRARYAVYGGRSTVAIGPDALVFDFPGLMPTDTPVAQQILARVHDVFAQAFPEGKYDTINVQYYQHLEFIDQSANPSDYLMQFTFPNPPKTLGAAVVLLPAGKCEIIAPDQSWQCTLAVERSLPNARAVFVAITFSMKKVDASSSYADKLEHAQKIVQCCHQLLGLEEIDAAG